MKLDLKQKNKNFKSIFGSELCLLFQELNIKFRFADIFLYMFPFLLAWSEYFVLVRFVLI